ncbi:MAG: hypothetical protein M1570_00405 [Chloroflexi bacterium]|nr:hypothetical protein [Chloroflexota bacterium]
MTFGWGRADESLAGDHSTPDDLARALIEPYGYGENDLAALPLVEEEINKRGLSLPDLPKSGGSAKRLEQLE